MIIYDNIYIYNIHMIIYDDIISTISSLIELMNVILALILAQRGTVPAMSAANRGQFRTATAGKVVWTEQMREIATSAVPSPQLSPGMPGVRDCNRAQGMVKEPLNHQSV